MGIGRCDVRADGCCCGAGSGAVARDARPARKGPLAAHRARPADRVPVAVPWRRPADDSDLSPAPQLLALCDRGQRSEEHTSELQSLMRISYAVFCLKKKKQTTHKN